MGLFKIWKDHVTQYSNRYKEVNNADGTITHQAVEGEIIQEGTPQNAANFNDLEQRVFSAGEVAGMAVLFAKNASDKAKALEGEVLEINLTNSKEYPFNNSVKTVALATARDNTDYTIITEAQTESEGGIGEVRVTDKQINGFKIAFTGSAKSVNVKCYVQGGYK